jgi:hypothetical protein
MDLLDRSILSHWVQWLRIILFKGSTRVGDFLAWRRKESRLSKSRASLKNLKMEKVQKRRLYQWYKCLLITCHLFADYAKCWALYRLTLKVFTLTTLFCFKICKQICIPYYIKSRLFQKMLATECFFTNSDKNYVAIFMLFYLLKCP